MEGEREQVKAHSGEKIGKNYQYMQSKYSICIKKR